MSIDPHDLDDADLKRQLEEALGDLAPGELEQASAAGPSRPDPDERGRIQGRILDIRGPDVFIDIGGKSEGFLTLDDFEADHPPVVGESHAFVMQGFDGDSGLMRLSLREARLEVDWESLHAGDVIVARVTGVNTGGLELDVGGQRAFMPKSQVDLVRHDSFSQFVGHKLECEITEINRSKRNLLVSHRRILEREREETREQLRFQLEEGQVRAGVVSRLTDFGAFVDLGGIDGLLHVSDMSYARIADPRSVLKPGDQVEVKILKIDLVKDRISLGTKQLTADPWELVPTNYRSGNVVDGRVTKLMDFGAFVEVEPGVEGLIPISELSWTVRIRHPRDVLNEGDNVRVSVLEVDAQKRRMSLSLKAMGADPWVGVADRFVPDAVMSGAVTRLADFGAFVRLEDGVEGLVHISELSEQRVRRVSDVVEVGKVVEVRVLSVDVERRRISLSMKRLSGADGDADAAGEPAPKGKPRKERKRERPLRGGLAW